MTSMRVAMIGYGFMGAAHSQGWRVAPRFFDLPAQPEMSVVVGPQRARRRRRRSQVGLGRGRHRLARGDRARRHRRRRHRHAGRLARRDRDRRARGRQARAVREAAREHRRRGRGDGGCRRARRRARRPRDGRASPTAAFPRRPSPATSSPAARIGEIRQVRAEYRQDWLVDAEAPLTWRLQKEHAGSGALGDIGAHAIDLSQYITGQRLTERLGHHRHDRDGAPAARRGLRPLGHRRHGRGEVTVDDVALFTGRFERRRPRHRSRPPASRTGRKNALRIEVSGSRGAIAFDLEDLNELEFYDAHRCRPTEQGFTQDPRDRARAPVRRAVVAGRPHARLRARLLAPGRRLRRRRSPTAPSRGPSFADGLQVQRVLDAVERSSAAGSAWTASTDRRIVTDRTPASKDESAMTRPITLFTGQWADLPLEEVARLASEWGYDGLEIACWGDHLDPWRWDDDEYVQSKLDLLERYGLKVWAISNHLKGQAVCDDPIDAAPPRHPLGRGVGRRRPRGRAAARRRGDEAHRAPRGEARREDRRRLHRIEHLEVRRDVPAGLAGDDRRRLPGLRRPLEPDPRRVRRGRRALRARGAPAARSRTTTGRPCARSRRSATARRSASTGTRRTSCLAGARPGRLHPRVQGPDLPRGLQGREAQRSATAATAGSARTCAWADLRRGWDFVSTGRGDVPWEARSARSTRSATTARSRSSGRTPAWTASSARPRRSSSCGGNAFAAPDAAFDAAFSTK